MLGENRQKYLDQLNERLRNRQRRIDAGEDPNDIEDDLLAEMEENTSGNILKDLDKRFDDEKDALLRRLRVRVMQISVNFVYFKYGLILAYELQYSML